MRHLLILVPLLLAGCRERPAGPDGAPADAPAATDDAVAAADAAIADLKNALMPRLLAALEEGGPENGVRVCSEVAGQVGREAAEKHGLLVGRTSHRLRNPANAPRSWARPYVAAAAGKRADAVSAEIVDLGGEVGVLRPIPLAEMCESCHGDPETISREVRALLAATYPEDAATGFRAGDLRGWFWAEAPKRGQRPVAAPRSPPE